MKRVALRHFDKSALNHYNAEVNAYFNEVLHMTELKVNTERLYDHAHKTKQP